MNEVLESALNRGAPIDAPVKIDLLEFISLFEKEELIEEYRNCSSTIISQISNIMDMYAATIILPTKATIVTEENHSKILDILRN